MTGDYSDQRLDAEYVARQVNLVSLAKDEGHAVRKRGSTHMLSCPVPSHLDRDPSCGLYYKGGKWRWKCYSCGAGGDAIGWFMQVHGLDYGRALDRAGAYVGLIDDPNSRMTPEQLDRIRAANRDKARRAIIEGERRDRMDKARKLQPAADLARAAVPVSREGDSSLVAKYLWSRDIDYFAIAGQIGEVDIPALKFAWLPYLPWNRRPDRSAPWYGKIWPVMVGIVQRYGDDGLPHFAGTHLTYLDPTGSRKADLGRDAKGDPYNAKLMWGDIDRGCIRLAPAQGREIGLCEGIETGLSLMQMDLLAGRDMRAIWPCLSQVGLAKVALPPDVDRVGIYTDPIGASDAARRNHRHRTEQAQRNAAWRPRHQGGKRKVVTVTPPPVPGDFNDRLMAGVLE